MVFFGVLGWHSGVIMELDSSINIVGGICLHLLEVCINTSISHLEKENNVVCVCIDYLHIVAQTTTHFGLSS